MKGLVRLFVLLFLFSSGIDAQNYGLGNAPLDLFKNYRIPTTEAFTYALGGSLNYSSSATNFDWRDDNSETSNFNFWGQLNPTAFYRFDSEDYIFGFTSALTGTYSKNKSESSDDYTGTHSENENDSKLLTISAAFNLRNYLSATSDFFYNPSAEVTIELNEHGRKPGLTNENYMITNGYKRQNYVISFGFGKGRQRNVTSVVSAIRLQQRMKQLNIINSDLPAQQVNKLAEKFSEYSYYTQTHERYSKYFWGDVDKILAESGISIEQLNGYAQNYLQEVPDEIRFVRYEGWYISLNFSLKYSNIYNLGYAFNNVGTPIKTTSLNEDLFFMPGIVLDYRHQLSLRSQFGLKASFQAGPNISGIRHTKQQYIAGLSLKYDYELTDRFVSSLYNSWSYNLNNTDSSEKNFQISLQSTSNFFIEDYVNLNLILSYYFKDNRITSSDYITSQHGFNLQLGFNYYFDRGILF